MRIPTYEDFLEEAASVLMLNKGVRMGQMKKGLPEIVAPGIGREPHTDPACRFPWEGVAVTTPRPACGSTQGQPWPTTFSVPQYLSSIQAWLCSRLLKGFYHAETPTQAWVLCQPREFPGAFGTASPSQTRTVGHCRGPNHKHVQVCLAVAL